MIERAADRAAPVGAAGVTATRVEFIRKQSRP